MVRIGSDWNASVLGMREHALQNTEAGLRDLKLKRTDPEVTAEAREDRPLRSADRVRRQISVASKLTEVGCRCRRGEFGVLEELMVSKHKHLAGFGLTRKCGDGS